MSNRGVLKSLDSAKTQLYHFTAIVIAGMGFFTDAYDLFCISGVTKLLGRLYYYDPASMKPGTLPANVDSSLSAVALIGTLAGQLFFGWAGDKFGRKSVYGFTLILMVACSFGQALSFGSTATAVVTTLCLFRFWLGFGIGGDYPLSATIMSEYANTKTRGAFIAAVFAQQGTGILTAAAVNLLISGTFNAGFPSPPFYVNPILSTPPQADFAWRTVVAFGGVPALATFYFRMKMPETARFTALVAKDARQAAEDMGKVLDTEFTEDDVELELSADDYGLFSKEFRRRHGLHLAGCAVCWFLLDVAFYSQNLFQKDIFVAIGWTPYAPSVNALEEMWDGSRASALIALCSTVPGYWVTVATIDFIGRWIIQVQGFFFMTLFMGLIAGLYPQLRGSEPCYPCVSTTTVTATGNVTTWALPPGTPPTVNCKAYTCGQSNHLAFIIMYALTFFFANFGPNSTTFIVPAELFPARLRSTCHGISAASGKAGAIIGAFGFLYASQDPVNPAAGYPPGIGLQYSLVVLTVTNGLGFLFTFLVPETNQKSLEELSGELEFSDQNGKGADEKEGEEEEDEEEHEDEEV